MLIVKNLNKRYKKLEAVKNVNLKVEPSKITLLLGPNGAGKSTIIKSISGLIDYSGEITIDDFNNTTVEAKRIFSYVGEIPYPFEYLTIKEHLDFMLRAYNIKDQDETINYYLDIFDLTDKQHKLGKELSKGMSQKLSIICGLIVNPKYILFDEPLIGLDPKAIRECKNIFTELKNKGTGLLISTHIIDTLHDIWDNAIIIKDGNVLLQQTREEFSTQYPNKSLEDIFFEITEG